MSSHWWSVVTVIIVLVVDNAASGGGGPCHCVSGSLTVAVVIGVVSGGHGGYQRIDGG